MVPKTPPRILLSLADLPALSPPSPAQSHTVREAAGSDLETKSPVTPKKNNPATPGNNCPVTPKRKRSDISDDVDELDDVTCSIVDDTEEASIAERTVLRPRSRSPTKRFLELASSAAYYARRKPTTSRGRAAAVAEKPKLETNTQQLGQPTKITLKFNLKQQPSEPPKPVVNDLAPSNGSGDIAPATPLLDGFKFALNKVIARSKAIITNGQSSEVAEKKRKITQDEFTPEAANIGGGRLLITTQTTLTQTPNQIGANTPQSTNHVGPPRTSSPKRRAPAENPFILKKWTLEGKFERASLVRPSPNSFARKYWKDFLQGKVPSLDNTMETIEGEVGPWRSAALWEFTGRTYNRSERRRVSSKSRHRKYAKFAHRGGHQGPGPSGLSKMVLVDEQEEELEVHQVEQDDMDYEYDWYDLFTGPLQACPSFGTIG